MRRLRDERELRVHRREEHHLWLPAARVHRGRNRGRGAVLRPTPSGDGNPRAAVRPSHDPLERDTRRCRIRRKRMKVVAKTETLQMFVGGRWVDSEGGETFEASSPATGEVIARLPKGTSADASRAVEAADPAGGNTLVWAPASSTSAISVKLMECLAEADLPSGAVNLVTGPGSVVGDEIAGHPRIAGVGFVGSTETGRSVARRAAGKHVMLELGGNGPIVIFEDADLGRAAEGTITGCFLCAGQSCTAGERILVQRGIQDAFLARLKSAMETVTLGDPFDEATTMGPLNNEGVALKMDEHVADAVDRGATVVQGGRRADGYPTRLYYEATVLRNVSPAMRVSREETFGPIAPLIPFADETDALAIANDSPYGLLGSVYTQDIDRALRFAQRLETGWVNVNESSNYWEAHIPFGGRAGKESGIGRVGGHRAIEQMTDLKTIIVDVQEH